MDHTPPHPHPDDAVGWIHAQADQLDPDGPPLVALCPAPAALAAADGLAHRFAGGRLTIEYAPDPDPDTDVVVQALGRALHALGAPVRQEEAALDPWSREYRSLTRYRPGLLATITGAREPAQVRALLPTGRGSLVLVAPFPGADLGELEIHPGARVYAAS